MRKMVRIWIATCIVLMLAGCSSGDSKDTEAYLDYASSTGTASNATTEETAINEEKPAATRLAMMNKLQNLTPAEANELLLRIEAMEAKIASLEGESSSLTVRPTSQSQENPVTMLEVRRARICPQRESHVYDLSYIYEYSYEFSAWAPNKTYREFYIGEKSQMYTKCQDLDRSIMAFHYYCTACGFDEVRVIFHTNATSTLTYSGEYQGDLTPTALVTMRGIGIWTHTFQCCCENAPIMPVTVTGRMYG